MVSSLTASTAPARMMSLCGPGPSGLTEASGCRATCEPSARAWGGSRPLRAACLAPLFRDACSSPL
eukprot:3962052-Alexandrium_andersonii.AAC.1